MTTRPFQCIRLDLAIMDEMTCLGKQSQLTQYTYYLLLSIVILQATARLKHERRDPGGSGYPLRSAVQCRTPRGS